MITFHTPNHLSTRTKALLQLQAAQDERRSMSGSGSWKFELSYAPQVPALQRGVPVNQYRYSGPGQFISFYRSEGTARLDRSDQVNKPLNLINVRPLLKSSLAKTLEHNYEANLCPDVTQHCTGCRITSRDSFQLKPWIRTTCTCLSASMASNSKDYSCGF